MQNKPNFRKAQINANSVYTRNYEEYLLYKGPKTNPIQTQFKPNSKPIAERVKLMQSVYLQRIKKKNTAKGYEKQSQNKPNSNPNKPNFFKGQNRLPKNPATPLFSPASIIACHKWGLGYIIKLGFVREVVK